MISAVCFFLHPMKFSCHDSWLFEVFSSHFSLARNCFVEIIIWNCRVENSLSTSQPLLSSYRSVSHYMWLVYLRRELKSIFIRKVLKISWLHDICRNCPSCRTVSGGIISANIVQAWNFRNFLIKNGL